MANLEDLAAFVAVVREGGFRGAARATGTSASRLSEALRRLETQLGVRLLHRTTRNVAPTDAGARLLERLRPALSEVESALDVVNSFRDRPAGRLRLNVPVNVAHTILPRIVPAFLAAYPDVCVEVIAQDRFVDLVAENCDAGIRYEERLEQDMIAVPIGPRWQRFAAAAAPAYLNPRGRPAHPSDLLDHSCLRIRHVSGAAPPWQFERDGKTITVDAKGPLVVEIGAAIELAVAAAVAGNGIIFLFEDWLKPYLDRGELEPVLSDWWPGFSGPFLYYSGRKHLPTPLRAFVDFVTAMPPLEPRTGKR